MKKLTKYFLLAALLLTVTLFGCKKLIEIEPPKHTLSEEKVFKDDSSAVAVLLNIYQASVSAQLEENTTTRSSMCADELTTTIASNFQFTDNAIQPEDVSMANLWKGFYATIYRCNLLLENLDRSAVLSEATRRQLAGEARFLRALAYFYLANLWGDVPLLLTTDVRTTAIAPRTAVAAVYQQIVADLKEAQSGLPASYPAGEKIRANRHAASALLARTYLYLRQWQQAETEASSVIDAGLYTPLPALNSVFVRGSREAILQWWNQTGNTGLGSFFIPLAGSVPSYQASDGVRNSFETGDNRKTAWIGNTTVSGQTYYYPFKYRQKNSCGRCQCRVYGGVARGRAIPDQGRSAGTTGKDRGCRSRPEPYPQPQWLAGTLQHPQQGRLPCRHRTGAAQRAGLRVGPPLARPQTHRADQCRSRPAKAGVEALRRPLPHSAAGDLPQSAAYPKRRLLSRLHLAFLTL